MLSFPAIGGQALEPLAQLMETAYIGRLGPVELGSAGISTNIFNCISKLFNIPLLSVATSFVAEDISKNSVKDSASGIGNLSAVFLFPILMYYLQLGATGAAISTVLSPYIVAFLLIWHLNKRAVLLPPKLGSLQFGGYLKSGPVAMAARQICIQVWLVVSLLTDALAASGQALIASSFSKGDYQSVKDITDYVLKIGLFTGVFLSAVLGVSFGSLATVFTKDAEVLEIVRTGVLFVSASQPLNALAFIFDGLHYGVSDFPYAAYSMMISGAICSTFLLYAPSILGLPGVWLGLTLFMGLRTVAGFARLLSKNGPWWFLHRDCQRTEVSKHNSFQESRCFYVVLTDGREEDFSYRKCLDSFIKGKYPDVAETFRRRTILQRKLRMKIGRNWKIVKQLNSIVQRLADQMPICSYLICIWIHRMVRSQCLRLLFAFYIIMENHWILCKFWR
ncbi:hypothetical protein ACJW30_11G065500 [Castanea mollissima]